MGKGFEASDWRQVDAVLRELLLLPASERQAGLAAMNLDARIRARVDSLLATVDSPGPLDGDVRDLLSAADTNPDPNAKASLEGRCIGHYRLQALLGQGGMSSVYRAVRDDGAYDAPVAFKLLSPALLGGDWVQRFRRETALLARLRHPGIASLLDAGIADDGSPWLVTELVDGTSIDRHCQDRALDLRGCIELVLQLCQAVAYVQRNLIVHRDIKCQNVLVTDGGQVKLLDFGIARVLGEQNETATLTRVFTPDYAAPEQIRGEPVTTATDVFGIGVVLYRLLTGVMPFTRGDGSRATGRPTPPSRQVTGHAESTVSDRRQRAQQLRGDLDNLVDKALAERAEDRYPSAQALADDLQAWLEHRPLQARRPSWTYRLRLFVRRRTELAVAILFIVLTATAGLTIALWQAGEARMQAQRAEAQAQRAETVRDFLAEVLSSARPSRGEIPNAIDILDAGSHRARTELMQTDPRAAGDVLTVTANSRYELSDFEGAYADLQDAIAAFEPIQPPPAEQLSALHSNMGRLLRVRGPGRDAGEHYRKAVHWAAVADLPPAWQWGRRASVAAWMMEYDDTELAERLLLDLLTDVDEEQVHGDHLLTALNALTTSMALLRRDADEQIPWHERRLEVAIRVHGPEDGWTAYTLADAIPTFRNAGLPERALEISAQALAVADRLYTEPDALAVVVYCNSASMLLHLGRHPEAVALYERYAAMDHVLKRANLHAESCWSGYAEALAALGRDDEALAAVAQAHAVLDRTGSERPVNRLNLCGLEARIRVRTQPTPQAVTRLSQCSRDYVGEDIDTTGAVRYHTFQAHLALRNGHHEQAADLLQALRERVTPVRGSILWLDIWLPSIWTARTQGRVDLASELAARTTKTLDAIRVDWNGRDVVARCLMPTSIATDCLLQP